MSTKQIPSIDTTTQASTSALLRAHTQVRTPSILNELNRTDTEMEVFMEERAERTPPLVIINKMPCCERLRDPRQSLYNLFSDPTVSISSFFINIIIMLLIILSCASFVLETLPQYSFPKIGVLFLIISNAHPQNRKQKTGDSPNDSKAIFTKMETFTIRIFTIEYLVRFLTAHSVSYSKLGFPRTKCPPYCLPFLHKTWLFFSSKMNLIDLAAILPWWIDQVSNCSVLSPLSLSSFPFYVFCGGFGKKYRSICNL